eukprot:scpid65048/ scgid32590/ 
MTACYHGMHGVDRPHEIGSVRTHSGQIYAYTVRLHYSVTSRTTSSLAAAFLATYCTVSLAYGIFLVRTVAHLLRLSTNNDRQTMIVPTKASVPVHGVNDVLLVTVC